MYELIWQHLNKPMALTPQMAEVFASVLREREHIKPELWEIQARIAAAGNQERRAAARSMEQVAAEKGVALINVQGPMVARGGMFAEVSGMQSYSSLAAEIRSAADDPNYGSILMVWDTPGGDVAHLQKLTDALEYAKGKKTVESYGDQLIASAGLWAASQTGKITMHPRAEIGSLGVIAIHTSRQKAREEAGLKDTILTSSPLKAAGNGYKDLDEDSTSELMRGINAVHAQFVQAVAAGRGVSVEKAQTWATGQVWGAEEALQLGLVDELGSLESVIERLANTGRPGSNGPSRLQPRGQGARKMDELLKALGLEAGATEQEALTALAALQADHKAASELAEEADKSAKDLKAQLEAQAETAKAHEKAIQDLNNAKATAERAALEAQVELVLTTATREQRITPATAQTMREQVLGTEEQAGTMTLEGLKATLETMPVLPQSTVNPPKRATDTTPQQQLMERAREIAKKGVPMTKAIAQATQEMNDIASQLVGR